MRCNRQGTVFGASEAHDLTFEDIERLLITLPTCH